MRGVRRFVDDLLSRRRTKPFAADEADESQIRTAIALRAAGPDTGPSDAFVDSLRERLRTELDQAPPVPEPHGSSRRRFVLSIAAASAASAAVGVGAEMALSGSGGAVTAEPSEQTITPDNGEWRGIVALKDLPDGAVRPFDVGSIVGFVHRTGDRLTAVSGVCTHLGCKLALDGPARQLNCPCHSAAFAVDGAVLHHRLPIALPPLPKLNVRESDGVVQVFVPPRQA
ncbi:Rieske 2Fe-2S domain-containing protein [Kribbella sp. NPDC000426]|uniref:Rieske (2Fe-2S) protein n=1 Tax=Kribbella sp. NPDC000426 TaxID=3154255 RepID=UPI00332F2FB5